jgi:hypothetical protein
VDLQVVWEPVNGLWVEGLYRYESIRYPDGIGYFSTSFLLPVFWTDTKNNYASLNVRLEL